MSHTPTLAEFYEKLKNADWFYTFADDPKVFNRGEAEIASLQASAVKAGPQHQWLLKSYSESKFSGATWGTEKLPLPPAPGTLPDLSSLLADYENEQRDSQFDPTSSGVLSKLRWIAFYAEKGMECPDVIRGHSALSAAWQAGQMQGIAQPPKREEQEMPKAMNMKTVGKYTFFYDKTCPPSNWYMMSFTMKGYTFNCGEQAMMFSKAMLFGDKETADKILAAKHPADHKALGREVKGFNQKIWEDRREGIQAAIVFARFDQNPKERRVLFETLDTIMVEAASNDKIWGIGLGINDSRIHDPKNWKGRNLLGKALDRGKAQLILKYPEEYAEIKERVMATYDSGKGFDPESRKG